MTGEATAEQTHFELWYSSEGVSITEYDRSGQGEPTVENEWWYTWDEVFSKLLDGSRHSPEVHAEGAQ